MVQAARNPKPSSPRHLLRSVPPLRAPPLDALHQLQLHPGVELDAHVPDAQPARRAAIHLKVDMQSGE